MIINDLSLSLKQNAFYELIKILLHNQLSNYFYYEKSVFHQIKF